MSEPAQFFYPDAGELATSLAADIAENLRAAQKPFLILPGGSSPKALITALAHENVPWPDVQITTTDERCVAMEDTHSNAGQVQRLFAKEGINIEPFWLHGGGDIDALFWPATVTVLGMGLDGHFASLFPGASWPEGERVIEALAPAYPLERLSLSFETLLETQRLILLVSDQQKWDLCQQVLRGQKIGLPVADLFEQPGQKLELHIAR